MALLFFLSYAHGDRRDNRRVAQFFDDVSTQLRVVTGADPNEVVGFHDHKNLRVGDKWPDELVHALSSALTFIPLFSPRYFNSRYCGQEWTVFADRVAAYRRETGRRAPSIIPVFWVPTPVPAAVGDIHHHDQSFDGWYEADGLRDLIRFQRHLDYETLVGALADRIREVAEEFPLPPTSDRPDFHRVTNAFDSAGLPPDSPSPTPFDPRRPDDQPAPPTRPILSFEEDLP